MQPGKRLIDMVPCPKTGIWAPDPYENARQRDDYAAARERQLQYMAARALQLELASADTITPVEPMVIIPDTLAEQISSERVYL